VAVILVPKDQRLLLDTLWFMNNVEVNFLQQLLQISTDFDNFCSKLTRRSCRREAATLCPRSLWPWPSDLESGVRVTCDVGYLCTNFIHPRPPGSRLRPDVSTDVRQHHLLKLMPPPRKWGHNKLCTLNCHNVSLDHAYVSTLPCKIRKETLPPPIATEN